MQKRSQHSTGILWFHCLPSQNGFLPLAFCFIVSTPSSIFRFTCPLFLPTILNTSQLIPCQNSVLCLATRDSGFSGIFQVFVGIFGIFWECFGLFSKSVRDFLELLTPCFASPPCFRSSVVPLSPHSLAVFVNFMKFTMIYNRLLSCRLKFSFFCLKFVRPLIIS